MEATVVENEATVPRYLCKIRPEYEAVKTGSGRKSRNKAVRVGTLALFQDWVKLLSWPD